jgi:hypothetical protein
MAPISWPRPDQGKGWKWCYRESLVIKNPHQAGFFGFFGWRCDHLKQ